jgi:hypothetical protein
VLQLIAREAAETIETDVVHLRSFTRRLQAARPPLEVSSNAARLASQHVREVRATAPLLPKPTRQ